MGQHSVWPCEPLALPASRSGKDVETWDVGPPRFPFQCELVFGETWEEIISEDALNGALQTPGYHERLACVAKLYIDGIHNLKESQPSPQVVVLAISDETLEKCSFVNRGGEQLRRRLLPARV